MKISFRYIIVMSAVLGTTACSLTRNVPKDDALYTGATVNVEDSTLTQKEKKNVEELTAGLPRPKPNSRFLGIPFKLILFNLGGDPQKGGFIRRFFHKAGEPPVLLSRLHPDYNVQLLQNYLQNNGYLQAEGSGNVIRKKRKAKAHYTLTPGPLYTLGSIQYDPDSATAAIGKEIAGAFRRSLLKPGDPFRLDVIRDERVRIDSRLKYRGYFYFNPDYLLFNADSTVGRHRVDLHLVVKKGASEKALKPYIINDVYIYPDYQLSESGEDTTHPHTHPFGGYFIEDPAKKFKPSLFQRILLFDSGAVYNLRDHNASLSRLISLDVFKFVKNRFEFVEDNKSDTGRLNAYYYLTPRQKKSLSFQLSGNTKSNNFVGSEIRFTFRNRNTFRAAEHLDLYVNAGTEVQYSGFQEGFNSYKLGGGINFTFPKFVIPFFPINTKNSFVPKTVFNLSYELLNRQKLYTLNSFKSEVGYNWKPNLYVEHELKPVSINFVEATNVTNIYRDSLLSNPLLKYAINTQYILGSNYSYTINRMIRKPKGTGIYFNAIGDVSGNIAGVFASANAVGKKELFGSAFDQYVKSQFDFRYYQAFGKNVQLASRSIIGIGYPYGNSERLPFVKQFFTGGTNSIRAFRSRSVGPGSFRDERSDSQGFFPDQGGDIKLELNTEFRFKINKILEPAVFVDAGNIWLMNEDTNQPGGRFSKAFLKELAAGAGVGLRLDFSILLFRLDVAIPFRKPWLPPGERWVFDQIDFSDKDWRRRNLILNLAIGYPF